MDASDAGEHVMRFAMTIGVVLSVLAAPMPCFSEPIDPAQAIAQKFSEADQPAARPAHKTKPRQAAKTAPDTKPAPAAPDVDYELDMLQRAHAEESERRKAAALAAAAASAPAPASVKASPATATNIEPAPEPQPTEIPERVAEPLPGIAPQPAPIAAAPIIVRPEPEAAPIQRLADAQPAAPASIPMPTGPRATVLLVLDRDSTEQTVFKPDPIICFDQQCWISDGLDKSAKLMPRSQAVTLKSTETTTGDSCSGKTACAFRNVAVPSGSQIEVVEVGESRGTASTAYTISPDTTCRKLDGELACSNALVTHTYRIWMVPEATAESVGASSLEEAVAEGLQGDDDDDSADGK